MNKTKTPCLFVAEPDGTYKTAPDSIVIRAAALAIGRALNRGPYFGSPANARKLMPALLGARQYETFCLAHLNKRHHLIHFEEIFRGTIDGASVHPREVVRSAMQHNTAAIICIHNHPSGDPEPSHADELITAQLKGVLGVG